jgi:hypothetical protein
MLRNLLNLVYGKKSKTTAGRKVSLTLEVLEDRMVPASVGYTNLGAIIPNVQVETVYYGKAWTDATYAINPQLTQEAKDLNTFLADITQSNYMTGLNQYSGLAYSQVNLPGRSVTISRAASPGKGQFIGSDMVREGPLNANNNLDEVTIVNTLKQEIANGHLPAPDANKLYMVFLAPGSPSQFDINKGNAAHHAAFMASNGSAAYYAVIDNPADVLFPTGYPNQLTTFQKLTGVASHEMVEAISNPADWDQVESGTNLAHLPAWKGSSGTEIGDITQNMPPAGGATSIVDGYVVQKYWSEAAHTSIAPGGVDYAAMTQVPTNLLSGALFTLTSLQQGSKPSAQLNLIHVVSTTPGVANFDGFWQGTDGHREAIVGKLEVSGGRSVNITVTRSGSHTVLFVGTLSTPNGNWRSGIEISQEKTTDSPFFGLGDTSDALIPTTTSASYVGYINWDYVNSAYPPVTKHQGMYLWA